MIDISNAQKIDGWMFNAELEWLAQMASASMRIIEVGAFLGRSTRAMADNTYGTVFALDIWNPEVYIKSPQASMAMFPHAKSVFWSNLSDHIQTGRVIPYQETLKYFKDFINPKNTDLIFIDGNHEYEKVKEDIQVAKEIMKDSGGIISGHDYCMEEEGVKRAVDELFSTNNVFSYYSIWWVDV